MEDRVVQVLPALVGEALLVAPLVFDEAVPVGVARDRRSRPALPRSPATADQGLFVPGALEIASGEQHEQGGRIARCRNIARTAPRGAQPSRRRASHAGSVPGAASFERICRLGLKMREPPQHALGDPRINPQHLERGDQAIAAERRRVPGNAGIGITPLRRLRHQHVEVGHGLAQHLVEDVVRRLDAGHAHRRQAHLAAMGEQAPEKGARASPRSAGCRTPPRTGISTGAGPGRAARSRHSPTAASDAGRNAGRWYARHRRGRDSRNSTSVGPSSLLVPVPRCGRRSPRTSNRSAKSLSNSSVSSRLARRSPWFCTPMR